MVRVFYSCFQPFVHVFDAISTVLQCKHVLAVQLADRLEKFVEKQVGPDDFVALLRTEI